MVPEAGRAEFITFVITCFFTFHADREPDSFFVGVVVGPTPTVFDVLCLEHPALAATQASDHACFGPTHCVVEYRLTRRESLRRAWARS